MRIPRQNQPDTLDRLLSYDALTGRVLLLDVDGKHTIIIDAQEVLDETADKWANERLCTLIVMGYVEESLVSRVFG
jgi:hypothetical protein